VSDVTIERMGELLQARPTGMLLVTDELSGWFFNMTRYAGGGQDYQYWLMGWDGRPYVLELRSRQLALAHLLIGLSGGVQPDKLAEMFADERGGGFSARFLYAWPKPPPLRALSDVSIGSAGIETLLKRLAFLPPRTPNRLPLSANAREEFEQLRRHVHQVLPTLDGREREWWSKVPTQALRLAGTLTFVYWALDQRRPPEPGSIRAEEMAAASRLLRDYFAHTWR
jgi:hypothetical protein